MPMQGLPLADLVAVNIRAELARTGITQHQLAQRMGVSQQAISRRLTGQARISLEDVGAIADILGVPVTRLMTDPVAA